MAKKRKPKLETAEPFKPAGVKFGELRARERALTRSVKYTVKYRDRRTGRFTKFKPGKSVNPVLFQDIQRLNESRTATVRSFGQAKVGDKKVVLPAIKRKTPLSGNDIVRIVQREILKRKVPLRNIRAVGNSAQIGYSDRIDAKGRRLPSPFPVPPPKKKKKKRRKKTRKRRKVRKKK